jgi:N6-adenosine-specific RNA methylase IME4
MDPPILEYQRRLEIANLKNSTDVETWSFEEISNLRIENLADQCCFLFMWVGSSEGLDKGRQLLKKWNFRRCEDIVWIKTNMHNFNNRRFVSDKDTIITHTKEHCLVGIKGAVKRGADGHFIHANIDTDVIVSEEPEFGSTEKPQELYRMIERFCLGRKRIELFGEDHNIRPGWVTLGKSLSSSNFDIDMYNSYFQGESCYPEVQGFQGGRYVGCTQEIENLRPRSPSRNHGNSMINPLSNNMGMIHCGNSSNNSSNYNNSHNSNSHWRNNNSNVNFGYNNNSNHHNHSQSHNNQHGYNSNFHYNNNRNYQGNFSQFNSNNDHNNNNNGNSRFNNNYNNYNGNMNSNLVKNNFFNHNNYSNNNNNFNNNSNRNYNINTNIPFNNMNNNNNNNHHFHANKNHQMMINNNMNNNFINHQNSGNANQNQSQNQNQIQGQFFNNNNSNINFKINSNLISPPGKAYGNMYVDSNNNNINNGNFNNINKYDENSNINSNRNLNMNSNSNINYMQNS